jgi:TP901 family phage tail tape measure protein
VADELKIKIIGSLDSNKTTDQIQDQLKKIESKLNVQIGVDVKAIEKIQKQVGELQKSFKTEGLKIIDDKDAIQNIDKAKKGVRELYTDVSKAVERYSQLGTVKIDKVFDPVNKEVQGFTLSVKNAEDVVEKLKFSLANIQGAGGLQKAFELTDRKTIDNRQELAEKVLQKEHQIESQIEKQNSDLEKQIELFKRRNLIEIETLRSKYRNTADHQGLDKLEQSVKNLEKTTPNASNAMQHLSLDLKELKGQASEAARSSMSMADSLRTAFQKFPVWLLASTSIYGTIAATRNLYDVIIQVDTAMTNLQKVMSQDTNFDNVMSNATDSAERFAKTITETLEAYETFAKQGYKDDDLQFLGDAGLVASNVGEIDTTAASEYLTSALVQWNKETNEAMGIVDSWNELSNDYATTVEKLAQGHGRAASTARNMGLSFDQTNAIIGSLTASTKQSGREIGNFLKNVLPRLTSKPAQDALDMVGVDLLDQSGNMRNVVDVYTEVAKQVKDMDSYNRSIVTEGLAGKYHISRMDALLNDLSSGESMYRSMVESSENSLGSASAENEKYMQSLQARVQETRLEFEKMALALGESFMTEGLIQTLKGLNQLMSAATWLTGWMGALAPLLGIVGLGFGALSKNLNSFTQGLIFSTENMTRAEVATKGLGKAFRGLAASTGVGLAFMAVGAILEGLISKMGEARQSQEELEQKNNELMASYKQSRNDVAGLTSEYERLQEVINSGNYTTDDLERYKEIQNSLAQSIPSLVIGEDQYGNKVLASADSVKAKVDMLERQLAIQEKIEAIENKEQAQENYDTAKESLEGYEEALDKVIAKANKGLSENRQNRRTQSKPNVIVEDIDAIISKIEELEKKQMDGEISANEMVDLTHLRAIQDEFTKAGIQVDQAKLMMVSANNELVSSSLATNEKISSSAKALIGDFSLFVSSTDESAKKIDSVLGSLGDNVESNPAFVKSFEEYSDAIDTYKEKVESGLDPKELEKYKNSAIKSFDQVKGELISLASEGDLSEKSLNLLEAKLGILANSSVFTTKSLDELAKSTGKSKEEIMNQLLLVPELAGEMEGLSSSFDGATQSQEEFASASERIAGVSQKNIDKIKESITIYQLLNSMENLNANQKLELASATDFLSSMYPALVKGKDLNVEAMQKEAEQNEILLLAIEKMANGQLDAQEEMTVQQALGARARLQVLSSELKALEKMANAYMQAAEDAYSQADSYGNEDALIQTEKFYRRSQQMSSKYNEVKSEIDSLIPSIDSLTGSMADSVDYSGKAYKSQDALEKSLKDSAKATEYSTYVTDKFKNSMEYLNLAMEKYQAIQAKFPKHSKEYQKALNDELYLLTQKKELLEDQAKSLNDQINSGNIIQTGLITSSSVPATTSSYSTASGGSSAEKIWNFFKSKGFSDSIAAGIMGNLQLESGLNPNALNASSGAFGLAQWLGGRKTALSSYAQSMGTSMSDINTQLNFLWKELNGSESRTMGYLKANQNASASTIAAMFDKLFERSEGTHIPQRQSFANGFLNKFSGTAGSISASTTAADVSKQVAQNLSDVDNAKSELLQLKQDAINVQDQIDQINLAIVESGMAYYDNIISGIDRYLERSEKYLAKYTSTSEQYRDELDDQSKKLAYKQDLMEKEAEYLRKQMKSEKLSLAVKDQLQAKLSELSLGWWDVNEAIQAVEKSIVDSKLEQFSDLIEGANNSIEKSRILMELHTKGSDKYNKEQQKIIKTMEYQQTLYHKEAEYIREQLRNEKLSVEQKKELEKQLSALSLAWWGLENQILDYNQQIADEAIDIIKKSYEQKRDYEIKLKEEQIKNAEEAHERKMELLEEEMDRYEEAVNRQLDLMKKQQDQDSFNKDITKLQEEESKIRSEIDTLSLDDSVESQLKRKELQEQLADIKEQIEDRQYDRSYQLREQNLQDELDSYQKDIEAKKKAEDEKFEAIKKQLDREKLAIEQHYDQLINDEAYYASLRQDIINGNVDSMNNKLREFLGEFKNYNSETISELELSWQSLQNLINNIINLQGQLGNISTPNTEGVGEGTGSNSKKESDWNKYLSNKKAYDNSDISKRKQLHQENEELRSRWGFPDGSYDALKNLKAYHKGGIVGDKGSRLGELANKLFNKKPNERIIKSLQGELQIPPQNIPNIFTNMKALITPKSNGGLIQIDNLISIGNVTKDANLDIDKLTNQAIDKLVSKMKPYGFRLN